MDAQQEKIVNFLNFYMCILLEQFLDKLFDT